MKVNALKAACLAVGIATAWGSSAIAGVSQPTEEIQLTLTPSNNLSHVYFLYGSNSSGRIFDIVTVALPDLTGGITTTDTFSVPQAAFNPGYVVIGVYDDTNQLITMSFFTPYAESHIIGMTNFAGVFSSSESSIATALENNDTATLVNFIQNEDDIIDTVGDPQVLVNFSNATEGGSILAEVIVPEPGTVALTTFGGLLILAFRHKRQQRAES